MLPAETWIASAQMGQRMLDDMNRKQQRIELENLRQNKVAAEVRQLTLDQQEKLRQEFNRRFDYMKDQVRSNQINYLNLQDKHREVLGQLDAIAKDYKDLEDKYKDKQSDFSKMMISRREILENAMGITFYKNATMKEVKERAQAYAQENGLDEVQFMESIGFDERYDEVANYDRHSGFYLDDDDEFAQKGKE